MASLGCHATGACLDRQKTEPDKLHSSTRRAYITTGVFLIRDRETPLASQPHAWSPAWKRVAASMPAAGCCEGEAAGSRHDGTTSIQIECRRPSWIGKLGREAVVSPGYRVRCTPLCLQPCPRTARLRGWQPRLPPQPSIRLRQAVRHAAFRGLGHLGRVTELPGTARIHGARSG